VFILAGSRELTEFDCLPPPIIPFLHNIRHRESAALLFFRLEWHIFFRSGTLIWQLQLQFSVYSWSLTFHVIKSQLSCCSAVFTGERKTWLRQKFNKSLTITAQLLLQEVSELTLRSSTLCPHVALMFLYRSHNNQQLFCYTELSNWLL